MRWLASFIYPGCIAALWPVNRLLAWWWADRFERGAVLHVSYMGHMPFQTVATLRTHGIRADYLAVGTSPVWSRADFQIGSARLPFMTALREFRMVWQVVSRYEIVHAHFMVTATRTGWELPFLERMGRKLVVHYRGCEIRDRDRNMAAHPAMNICEECDYRPPVCQVPLNVARRALAARYADAVLVTTPDLQEFAPEGQHMPFFAPAIAESAPPAGPPDREFVIVHATNHPGIEGTRHLQAAVEALRARGHRVRLHWLHGASHDTVLDALAHADLAVGKMKMGYYANAQIESMMAGVPTITFVRPEFMTEALQASAFIFATLESLERTIEHYLTHPAELAQIRARARDSVLRLHDNAALSRRYAAVYERVRA